MFYFIGWNFEAYIQISTDFLFYIQMIKIFYFL